MSPEYLRATAPGYWRNETSGVLAPVVTAYIYDKSLNDREIGIMRDYLRQWINATGWDCGTPSLELRALRARVALITSRNDISLWLWDALQIGIDPL